MEFSNFDQKKDQSVNTYVVELFRFPTTIAVKFKGLYIIIMAIRDLLKKIIQPI